MLNKSDVASRDQLDTLRMTYHDAVVVSARKHEGLDTLKEYIVDALLAHGVHFPGTRDQT